LTTIWVTENAATADIARTCAVANDLPKIGVNGSTGVFGLLISKRRLILKLFAAWRVGYQFSEQLNLKRRVPNCGRYRCDSAAPHSKQRNPMDNMLLIIIVLLLLFGGGGYWARGRYW
jgi:hypothetical protein